MYVSNIVLNVNMFLVVISIACPFSFELISENFGYQANADYYLVPIDLSNLFLKAICLKILIPQDDLQCTFFLSNVVLNVNMFLVVTSITTLFSFELISENVSNILGIKRIQTITWYL